MRVLLLSSLFFLFIPIAAIGGSTPDGNSISWFMMFVILLGGLVFFLYAMNIINIYCFDIAKIIVRLANLEEG